jgi:hypothetical protein
MAVDPNLSVIAGCVQQGEVSALYQQEMDRMNKNHLSTLILNLGFLQGTSVGRARDHLLGWGTSDGGEGGTICREKEPFLGNMHHLQGERTIYGERGIIFRERNYLPGEGNNLKKDERLEGRKNYLQ